MTNISIKQLRSLVRETLTEAPKKDFSSLMKKNDALRDRRDVRYNKQESPQSAAAPALTKAIITKRVHSDETTFFAVGDVVFGTNLPSGEFKVKKLGKHKGLAAHPGMYISNGYYRPVK